MSGKTSQGHVTQFSFCAARGIFNQNFLLNCKRFRFLQPAHSEVPQSPANLISNARQAFPLEYFFLPMSLNTQASERTASPLGFKAQKIKPASDEVSTLRTYLRSVHTRELAPETRSRNTLPGKYPNQCTRRTRRGS